MSEILLRVTDKINNVDSYLDSKCLKRGDIVAVRPDGWLWGTGELTHPFWRVLKLPNVSVAQAESFLGPEFNTDPAHPSKVLRRRAFCVDLDHGSISASLKSWLLDDTRKVSTHSPNLTASQFLTLKKSKPLLIDPNVIG